MTLRQALTAAARRFAGDEHLRETANRDAELLLLDAAGISRVALLAYPERELSAEERARYEEAIRRRMVHEPIQYITGRQEFYGLALGVSPDVLIPRPETEHLVEEVLGRMPHGEPVRIVDVGTGSGAIAIALAVHLPRAEITAVDLSPGALAVAGANAREHGVGGRIRFLLSDLLEAVLGDGGGFDAVVSNPPYIPEPERARLHPEVRDYEPATALFAGLDGLDLYRRLIPQALAALRPGGLLALEIGYGQRDALTALLGGWREVAFVEDLRQISRVAVARRPVHRPGGWLIEQTAI